jgi:APA family basic amino acid/polyamine antiporter
MTENSNRRLGIPSASALVIANMIGAGVFTTSGFALADLGSPSVVLLAWVVGGLLALCGALSYGALARRFPESGGEYLFLSRTVHPLAGFLAGWVSLLAGFTAPIAAAALGLQAYVTASFPLAIRPEWVGTAAIVAAGLMHGLRMRQGVLLQNAAVAIKVIAISAFICVGALRVQPPDSAASTVEFELGAFAVTLVWISFAYSGWNAAIYVAGEVRDPERNLPRALLLATATVMIIYVALNAVLVYAAPVQELAGQAEIGAIAARALGGQLLERALSAVVALGLFTSVSAMVMAGPRVYEKMAQDGLFPRVFQNRGDVPAAAVGLQAGLALVVLWVSGLVELLGYIGFTLGLSAASTVGGLMALRLREGPERLPIPGFPWVPGLFIAATLGTTVFMVLREPMQAGLGFLTAAAGVPVYIWLRRRSP